MNRPTNIPAAEPDDNEEQQDRGQAQDVAADALGGGDNSYVESERGNPADPGSLIPDDVPDLVDRMNEMVRSGRIDNDAYQGEPMHDDEEEQLGVTDPDDDAA